MRKLSPKAKLLLLAAALPYSLVGAYGAHALFKEKTKKASLPKKLGKRLFRSKAVRDRVEAHAKGKLLAKRIAKGEITRGQAFAKTLKDQATESVRKTRRANIPYRRFRSGHIGRQLEAEGFKGGRTIRTMADVERFPSRIVGHHMQKFVESLKKALKREFNPKANRKARVAKAKRMGIRAVN